MLVDQKIEPIENEQEFNLKAKEIYRTKYQKKLEADESLKGKIAAIEGESGDCFIGESVLQAGFKAREKYPHKQFFFFRVGFKAVYSHKEKIATFGLKQLLSKWKTENTQHLVFTKNFSHTRHYL